jgi:MSHA pilin protein MshC
MSVDRLSMKALSCRGGLRSFQRGLTLIELIMVIIILGVLAVFAAPRVFNTGDFTARGFHDETMSLLRYAQKTAIAQRRTVCVALNDTGVTLSIDTKPPPDATCDAVLAPPNTPRGGNGLVGTLPKFAYTALGSTDQTAAISITIPNASNITVEADTGYVYVHD